MLAGECTLNHQYAIVIILLLVFSIVILYTGCDCYRDLRETQRNGDYEKWKVFDASLNDAVEKLSYDPNTPKIKRLECMQLPSIQMRLDLNVCTFTFVNKMRIFHKLNR